MKPLIRTDPNETPTLPPLHEIANGYPGDAPETGHRINEIGQALFCVFPLSFITP
ncbi:hypothetical protein [Methanogenium organophilum]|uniref:Uncharacterized protein n=1 Tax=Methanogenium organophilum TaxID=2199 RepID=A0A9X9S5H4_METOG|nr:hypothetical protein [Methanogenium organophilum]WAI01830.1 hypothetical protein OU421_02855 [Methanogenium organophilum]